MKEIKKDPEFLSLIDLVSDYMEKKFKKPSQYPEETKELLKLKLTEEFIGAINKQDGSKIKRYAEMICYVKHCQVIFINTLVDLIMAEELKKKGNQVLGILGGGLKRLIKENRERED